MKKEKLTLKKLQAQLELLLKNSTPQKPSGVEVTSITTTLNNKLSSLLVSLKKLPVIGKLIKFLSLDKLSIWGAFVLIRKVFIYFNAFLGIYFMLKLSGLSLFSHEGLSSIIAGIVGVSYNYLDLIKSFSSKALNSTLEFFNYKIIPNDLEKSATSPDANNSSWFDINQWVSGSNHKTSLPTIPQDNGVVKPSSFIDQIEDKTFSLRKTYIEGQDQSLPVNNPWYKDITNWYYIIGGVAVTVSIIGLGYIAYSYYLSVYYPDVSPPSPSAETGKGLDSNLDNDLPASPASDTSTIRPTIRKPKGPNLPPINTDHLDGLPAVPKVETPLNPWTTPTGWRRPSLTPIQEVGIKPGFTNPLSPEKVTNTDPNVIRSLPSTPTDVKPNAHGGTKDNLENFMDSLDL